MTFKKLVSYFLTFIIGVAAGYYWAIKAYNILV